MATVSDKEGAAYVSLDELSERLPDYELSAQKLTRWIRKGCRGRFLAAKLFGSRWKVRPIDLESFLDQLTFDSLPASALATIVSDTHHNGGE